MADLKVYAENLESTAEKQLDVLVETGIFDGCKVRVMPDAHAGAGCVVGFTAELGTRVVPNLVGVDIGCGMLAVEFNDLMEMEPLDCRIRSRVPSGFSVHREDQCDVPNMGLLCFDELRNVDRLNKSMGTLGGGNHFIEVDESDDGSIWVVIHSGSRNLGLQVAQIYQSKAIESCKADIPNGLKYLEGELAESYLHDMRICQKWALWNRATMMQSIIGPFAETAMVETIHNYIGDDGIIRKGAVSSKGGETMLIPFNMRDGSVIAKGKGNPDWNFSAPHGAGRIMSRSKAKKTLDVADFEREMEGVYSTTVCAETVDEAPGAYKDAETILRLVAPTLEVVHRLKPIYNFKAC